MSFAELWSIVERVLWMPTYVLSRMAAMPPWQVGGLTAGFISTMIVGGRFWGLCPEVRALLLWPVRSAGLLMVILGGLGAVIALSIIPLAWATAPFFADRFEPGALLEWERARYAELWPLVVKGSAGGLAIGILCYFTIGRWLEPAITEALHRATKNARAEGLTDARTVTKHLPRATTFDPRAFFPAAARRNSVFLGLDECKTPVLVPRSVWEKSHVQVMGGTGKGKGVAVSTALVQAIEQGDVVVVVDPKGDEWCKFVLFDACKRAGKPFHLIDLRDRQPRINLLARISSPELNELMIAGFSLGKTGEQADFYRTDDRKAARLLAALADAGPVCLASVQDSVDACLDEKLIKAAKGFLGQLEEVAALPVIQTLRGLDLAASLGDGGCIYVIGSTRDEAVITLQKMFLVRIMQLIESRPSGDSRRHVTLFLDEFKYLVSHPALAALGTIRDKGCNIVLAHQSLGDFSSCGPALSEDAVRAVVVDNTPIKWFYQTSDEPTAKWIAAMTGTILVNKPRITLDRNEALAETVGDSRVYDQVERHRIDTNMVQHLPKGCAVCIGVGHARLAFAAPIVVPKGSVPAQARALLYKRRTASDLLLDVGSAKKSAVAESKESLL